MANPSNYRYDAYSDIPSNITLTERHLVPAISPYIVTLTEVPVKSAPSTTSARYINDISGGSAVYGESLTEVSATPVAGQYTRITIQTPIIMKTGTQGRFFLLQQMPERLLK